MLSSMNVHSVVGRLKAAKGIVLGLFTISLFAATFAVAGVINVSNIFLAKCLTTIKLYMPEYGYLGGTEPFICPGQMSMAESLDILGRIWENSKQIKAQQTRINLLFPDWFEKGNQRDVLPERGKTPHELLGELILHSRQGNHAEVLQIVSSTQQNFGKLAPLVRDQVVLAETNLALDAMSVGKWTEAMAALYRAIQEHPNDLWAQYLAQKVARENGDFEAETSIRQRPAKIGMAAFEFSDIRRAKTTAQAIVHLLHDEIWDAPEAYSVVSSMIWKSPDRRAEELLNTLLALQPERIEWQALRQELEWRQNTASDFDSSTNACPASTMTDPRDTQSTSASNFLIARELDVDITQLTFGPSMIPRSVMDTIETEERRDLRWHPAGMIGYQGYGSGELSSGVDVLCKDATSAVARMSGLWSDHGELTPAWTGWWLWDTAGNLNYLMTLEDSNLYALSFDYRTEWVENNSFSLWLNDEPAMAGQLSGEHYFARTDGVWRSAVVVGYGTATSISPLFRLAGKGQVWLDNMQLRQVLFSNSSSESIPASSVR